MSDLSKRMLDGEICNPHFCKDMSERGDCLCVMSGNRIAELEAALNQAKQHFRADEPLKAFIEICAALVGGEDGRD
jgi:hypothetical protein